MRIIGGTLKGKTITPPTSFKARPTTDFAKEGLFNTLINQFDFETISVLDLFSGTGSISYEFASRGCKEIYSIEMNPIHYNFIKRMTSQLKLPIQAVHHNVFDFLEICKIDFDIIFADPPYDIAGLDTIPDKIFNTSTKGYHIDSTQQVISQTNQTRAGTNLLRNDGILILEHPAAYSFKEHPHFIKEKKYGNVHFSFFQ